MAGCSVIIVSYQSGPILFATLKRVLAQAELAEVLVVDNGNAPHTLSRLQQMSLGDARLKILSGQGNQGIAKASNIAAAGALGEYLLFLHPDCVLPPDALKHSIAGLTQMPDAMVAGAWLLDRDGSEQITGHAYMANPKSAVKHVLRFGAPYPPTRFVPSSAFEVAAVAGPFICISKAHFFTLGGFDDAYFLCVEDMDLCRRVRNAGKRVIKLPQVQVVHLHNVLGGAYCPFIAWKRMKGLMHYYKKYDAKTLFLGARWGLNMLLIVDFLHYLVTGYVKSKVQGMGFFTARSGAALRAWIFEFLVMGLVDLPEGKDLQGRQVLLTGATGQVGACVLRRLLAQGACVVALTRQEPLPYFHERLWWVKGDLSDVAFALPDIRLDAVVHCAPLMHLPRHIARLAGMGVTRVVAFGTTAMFSQATSKNWHEKEMVDDLRAAEGSLAELCAKNLVRWTILRPTLMYGLEMDNGITRMTRFVRRFRFFPLYPPALGKRHPVHADDVGKAALQVMDHASTYDKAYNLSGRDIMSFREMVERIFEACGRKKRVLETTLLPFVLDVAGRLLHKKEINAEIAYRMNDDLVFFHDDARDDFGYAPRGFLHELEG